MTDKEVVEFKEKFIKLKMLHDELLKAFADAKHYKGDTPEDKKVFKRIESLVSGGGNHRTR